MRSSVEGPVLSGQAAVRQLLRRGPVGVQQRVEGAEDRFLSQKPLQDLQVKVHGAEGLLRGGWAGGIRKQTGGQGFVEKAKPALLRLGTEPVQDRPAKGQKLAAMGALPLKLQDAFFKPAAVQQMNQAPPVQPQTAGEAVAEGIHQRGEIKAFLHGKPPWRGSLPEEGREGKGKWNRVKCPGRKARGGPIGSGGIRRRRP